MQGSTKTVGGGSATPTANAYQQFLQKQLGTGQNSPFQDALSGMMGGGPKIDTNQGMANLPGSPSYAATNFKPLTDNLDLSGFGKNVMNGMPDMATVQGMMGSNMNGLNGNFSVGTGDASMNFMNSSPMNFGVGNVGMPNADVNSPRAMAIKNVIDRQNQMKLANTRARFSSGGMSSLGSGAGLAEAQTNAEGQNQLLAGLQGITQQDIGNTLDYGRLNTGNMLQSQGMQSQDILGRMGLQNSNLLGNRQISSQEAQASAGNALQAAMAKGQLGNQGMGQMLDYLLGRGNLNLGAEQLGSQNAYNQGMFNNNATQTMNQNMFNENQGMNQFNTNMFGQQSQNALQNQAMGNQFGLGQGQLQSQNIQQILAQLFGGFNQASGQGIAQAQTVQTPSPFSQIAGAATGVLGAAAPFLGPMGMGLGMLGGLSSMGANGSPQGMGSNWRNPYQGASGIMPINTGMMNMMAPQNNGVSAFNGGMLNSYAGR